MTSLTLSHFDKATWLRKTLAEAERCLKVCLKEEAHKRCRSYAATRLPKRVIDVGPKDGSRDPFLYITECDESTPSSSESTTAQEGNGSGDHSQVNDIANSVSAMKLEDEPDYRYTTLSYCWGKTQHFTTTNENIKQMTKKIPWNDLPLTIQDAILVTRALGIKYIWVDALCIIQDSPSDWAIESVKMAEIYGGSHLTISAALGPDVHHGLMGQATTDVRDIPSSHSPLQRDPLYSRAWGLQERMLSPRVLIFGSEGLFFECYACSTSIKKLLSNRLPPNPTPWDWHIVVQDYTCRDLTEPSDKFPALNGLANVYAKTTKKTYICGLWKETLIFDLLWRQLRIIIGNEASLEQPAEYRAPSWSWASLNGNCMFPHNLAEQEKFKPRTEVLATFLDTELTDLLSSPPAKPIEGDEFLLLHGPLIKAKIKNGVIKFTSSKDTFPWLDMRDVTELEDAGQPLTMKGKEEWANSVSRVDTWCLLLGAWKKEGYGLVLVEALDFGEGHFRRVGSFLSYDWKEVFKSVEKRDLLLI